MLPQGGHLLVTSYGLFYLSSLLFGTHPAPYFVSVLALHLINVALLFSVIARATRSERLGCFGALLWGTSPRLEGTLGWYSVFGHAVVGAALLWILHDLTSVERSGSVSWAMRIRWALLTLAAATSFGTGIGVALVLPVVAFLILPRARVRRAVVSWFVAVAASVPPLYIALHRLFRPRFPLFGGVSGVLETFGSQVLALLTNLVSYGVATTVLGTLWPEDRDPGRLGSVLLAVFVAALLVTLVGGGARSRRYVLAALALVVGSYAMVAVGRAPFYVRAPDIGGADRYHYVAGLAITLAYCVCLAEAARRIRLTPRWSTALLAAAAAALMGAHFAVGRPIDHHDNARDETAEVVAHIRTAVAQAPQHADVYIANRHFLAMGPIFADVPNFPGWAGVFIDFFPDNVVDGHRIYFIEPDDAVRRWAANGRRSAGLLLPRAPGTAGAGAQR